MDLAPDEGMHTPHGGSHDQTKVLHAQSLDEKAALSLNHVVIGVFREGRAKPVRRLRRPAMPDTVRQDDEVTRHVQRLSRPEQLIGELGPQKLGPGSARAMQHQDRIGDSAPGIPPRFSQRPVMHPQAVQPSAVVKLEIVQHVVAFADRPGLGHRRGRRQHHEDQAEQSAHDIPHVPGGRAGSVYCCNPVGNGAPIASAIACWVIRKTASRWW